MPKQSKKFSSAKHRALLCALTCYLLPATCYSEPFGLIGGQNYTGGFGSGPAIAYQVAVDGTLTPIGTTGSPPLPTNGVITGVAINSQGLALLGGQNFTGGAGSGPAIAYSLATDGTLSPIGTTGSTLLPANGSINGASINNQGVGLLGGRNNNGPSSTAPAIAYYVSPDGALSPIGTIGLPLLPSNGIIKGVSLNDAGMGLLGGQNESGGAYTGPAIAYQVAVDGTLTQIGATGSTTLPSNGVIFGVALNDAGAGLLGGGNYNSGSAIAYQVAVDGTLTQIGTTGSTILPTNGSIDAVAINSRGEGLLGGENLAGAQPAVAYLMSPSGELTQIGTTGSTRLPSDGFITGVALNDAGVGLLGGQNFTGGFLSGPAVLYLMAPGGALTQLGISGSPLLPSNGSIYGVALALLSQIPTSGLTGNNLQLANYINTKASQVAYYFVPAVFDGTLNQALESAAPTRNAFSLFSADNNLFFLNQNFSQHTREARAVRRQMTEAQSLAMGEFSPHEVFAANADRPAGAPSKHLDADTQPYQLWGNVLGALAYQKAESQSPAFQDATGGLILGFDAQVSEHGRVGGGGAYAYTHLHEQGDAGRANVNQEYLFAYGSWDAAHVYIDGAVWGGLFQTSNLRKIQMTGFAFESKSHPKGWQLAPHVELGYDWSSRSQQFTAEPFVMFDWANNWQGSYHEVGDGPFNMGQKHHYSSFLRSEVGCRFYEVVSFRDWRLIFQEAAGYVNKKPFKVGTVTAFLVGSPGAFTVETFTTTQNLGVGGFEMIFEPLDSRYPYGTIAYQGEFGKSYQSHVASLNVAWDF